MTKIAIFQADSNGNFSIPAVKGGAVSTLVEHIIADNSKNKCMDLTVISYYDKEAEKASKKYKNIRFIWVKIPKIFQFLDKSCFFIVKTFFPNKKAISYKTIFSLMWYILVATKILKNNEFDKVVIENNTQLIWIIKLSRYKGQFYYHLHNVPRFDAKCRKMFAQCNGFLCVSKYVASQIIKKDSVLGEISNDKVKVLYNCVDTEIFSQIKDEAILEKYRKKYQLKPNDKVIIFVGRLSEEKGADIVLRAIARLPDTKLLVCGSYMHNIQSHDIYREELHRLAETIKERVIFTGYINNKQLPVFYSLADIAVLPSVWAEPAGLTMVEALSCNLPVITTKTGGIPEYVSNHAILLDNNKNLEKQIVNSIKNFSTTNSQKSSGYIKKHFSEDGYAQRFIEALDNIGV